jgi:hypothetical protein
VYIKSLIGTIFEVKHRKKGLLWGLCEQLGSSWNFLVEIQFKKICKIYAKSLYT